MKNSLRITKTMALAAAGGFAFFGVLAGVSGQSVHGRAPGAIMIATDTVRPPTVVPEPTGTPVPEPTATPVPAAQPPRAPELQVRLELDGPCTKTGEVVRYRMRVTNQGTSPAYNVQAYSVLGEGLEYVSSASMQDRMQKTDAANTLRYDVGSVAPEQEVVIEVTARITAGPGATLSVLGRVETSTPGDQPTDNLRALGCTINAGETPAADAPALTLLPQTGMDIATRFPQARME
jgi:uncharacterized repeat protein (TIGR01451 family)